MKYPKFLQEKGTIAFVAPSFGCAIEPYKSGFEKAREKWQEEGFSLELGPNCYASDGVGISSTPEKCGEELTEYYCNTTSDCIISCGGGELMCEILDYVDFDKIQKASPKWYMGYSDNTNMTFLLTTLCDTAAIYGPCAAAFGMEPRHRALEDAMQLLQGEKLTMQGYDKWERESLKDEEHPCEPYNLTETSVIKYILPDGRTNIESITDVWDKKKLDIENIYITDDDTEDNSNNNTNVNTEDNASNNTGADTEDNASNNIGADTENNTSSNTDASTEANGIDTDDPSDGSENISYGMNENIEGRMLKKEIYETNVIDFEGRLLGGCMDCLVNLLGTKYDRVTEFAEKYKDDGILWFIEPCDLNLMSIRRAMWQMEHAGWFQYCKGFLIGRPRLGMGVKEFGIDQYQAVYEMLKQHHVPVMMDLDIGHLPPMMPLICGSMARVVSDGKTYRVEMKLK